MRLLGIDFGEKHIGVAVGDEETRLAFPLTVLSRTSDRGAIQDILAIIEQEEIGGLVVGEPRRLDGSRGEAAVRVRSFSRRLAEASRLPLHFIDESLSSREASSRRLASGRRPPKGLRLDSDAAQILLQEWLDLGSRK